jgi:hypothetical protein
VSSASVRFSGDSAVPPSTPKVIFISPPQLQQSPKTTLTALISISLLHFGQDWVTSAGCSSADTRLIENY